MSRSGYSDDCDYLELYRGNNVYRSMRSKAGQARLRELRDALLAMPVKALEADIFVGGTSDAPKVCALGAWALAKCGGDVAAARALVPNEADDYETADALKAHDWPRLVVHDAIFWNDEAAWNVQTAEQRYAYVLRRVEEQILPPAPAQETERGR
jgi:hypothetical protein